jgi:NAD-dependent SIR2 family protein deacetylase
MAGPPHLPIISYLAHATASSIIPTTLELRGKEASSNFRWEQPLSIGKLKPDVLLYGDPHPDDNEIVGATEDDLTICPDLVIVVGTLEISGARSIAKRFCQIAG